jgi:hypothetical protein
MKPTIRLASASLLIALVVAVTTSGCSSNGKPVGGTKPSDADEQLAAEIVATRPVGNEPIIPLNELPKPGDCRIWYPGKSPLEQPSAGPCTERLDQVPPGAWLVYRPEQTPQYIQIREYPVQSGGTIVVKNYDARTGLYVGPGN